MLGKLDPIFGLTAVFIQILEAAIHSFIVTPKQHKNTAISENT